MSFEYRRSKRYSRKMSDTAFETQSDILPSAERQVERRARLPGSHWYLYLFYLVAVAPGIIALVRDRNPNWGTRLDALDLSIAAVIVVTCALSIGLIAALGLLASSNANLARRFTKTRELADAILARYGEKERSLNDADHRERGADLGLG